MFELGSRVLELEMRKGARVVEKRHRPRPLYKGGEYQESSARSLETYLKTRSHTNSRHGVAHARIDGRCRNNGNTISALSGRANKTALQHVSRWAKKNRFVLGRATIQGHDAQRLLADQIYAMPPTVVCEDHLADLDTV